MAAYLLSDRDRDLLQSILDAERQRRRNISNRPNVVVDDPQAPEVYIVRSPGGGIPGAEVSLITGTGEGAGLDLVPGAADCFVYARAIVDGQLVLVNQGFIINVLNLSRQVIDGGQYFAAERDKFGSWVAPPCLTCSPEPTGTGTGTGSGSGVQDGCCPNAHVPVTLWLTLYDATLCDCVNAMTPIELVWSPVNQDWTGTGDVCGFSTQWLFACQADGTYLLWFLNGNCVDQITTANPSAIGNSCAPFTMLLGPIYSCTQQFPSCIGDFNYTFLGKVTAEIWWCIEAAVPYCFYGTEEAAGAEAAGQGTVFTGPFASATACGEACGDTTGTGTGSGTGSGTAGGCVDTPCLACVPRILYAQFSGVDSSPFGSCLCANAACFEIIWVTGNTWAGRGQVCGKPMNVVLTCLSAPPPAGGTWRIHLFSDDLAFSCSNDVGLTTTSPFSITTTCADTAGAFCEVGGASTHITVTISETPCVVPGRHDNFNRANQTPLGTPSDGGSTWVDTGLGNPGQVLSNTCQVSAGPAAIAEYLACSSADGTAQVTAATVQSSGGALGGLLLRFTNLSNYATAYWSVGGGWFLNIVVAGVSNIFGPFGSAPSNGDRLKVVLLGDVYKLYVNSVLLNSTTLTGLSGVNHGVFLSDNNPSMGALDDWSFIP
jgi:hypothetical protein